VKQQLYGGEGMEMKQARSTKSLGLM
jgi:hypothetical protein